MELLDYVVDLADSEEIQNAMAKVSSMEEVIDIFKKYGIIVTEEEMNKLLKNIIIAQEDDLTEIFLEYVSGGSRINGLVKAFLDAVKRGVLIII